MDANMLAAKARELKDRLGWTELDVIDKPEAFEEVVRVAMDLAELVGDLCRRVADLEAEGAERTLEANLAEPVGGAEMDDDELAEALDALAELAKPMDGGEPE